MLVFRNGRCGIIRKYLKKKPRVKLFLNTPPLVLSLQCELARLMHELLFHNFELLV